MILRKGNQIHIQMDLSKQEPFFIHRNPIYLILL